MDDHKIREQKFQQLVQMCSPQNSHHPDYDTFLYDLGMCYEYGRGTIANMELAFRTYEQAYENGNTSAIRKIAECYFTGIGTALDHHKAITHFTLFLEMTKMDEEDGTVFPLSKEEYGLILHQIGICYENMTKYDVAFTYYRNAATTFNHSDSQIKVGIFYDNGFGVPSDPREAYTWYNTALYNQNWNALIYIGSCHFYGHGVEKNLQKALEYFKESYEKTGNVTALNIYRSLIK